jgi:hypothetical protein
MTFQFHRKDSSSLPEIRELEIILDREAKRPITQGKERQHFANFDLVIHWLEILGLPTDGFKKDFNWQDLVLKNRDLPAQVVEKTLKEIAEENTELESVLKKITKYLGEEDIAQTSDVIFVFGSKSLGRIETAVKLWKRQLAPVIFITGGMPIYEKREQSEALIYKEWAMNHKVPESAIIIHPTAISVADNVRGGLNEMDEMGLAYRSLILVTAWFAMRRSWAHMMKYVPIGTKLYRTDSLVTIGGNYDPDSWWKNESGIKVVFNEFAKLRISEILNSS